MPQPTDDPVIRTPNDGPAGRGRGDVWRARLVRVPSGVAAGRTKRGRGNALTEWWTLFSSRDHFDVCSAADPLRFADPLLFAQITKEFDHVFDRSESQEFRSRAWDEHGPSRARS